MGRQTDKFLAWFNFRSELENYETIHHNIEQGIVFKGTNLWVLVFAIVLASVGLNVNSTAVIIGAMLISPLMGPINGIGYSLATYDFTLFRRSLKNFLFAVGVSLVTSTLYFTLSPINAAHSELLARTSPTIYDVIIALFGGMAGIVATSSRVKGNVIPGVAIATALMPPICTAGYGLATLQFNFTFGAIYLFTINSVFIAYSALIICQYLKFPLRSIVDIEKKKKVDRFISAIIILTLIPSIFFGYNLVQNEKFSQASESFVKEVSLMGGNYLQDHSINPALRTVDLLYSGYGLTDSVVSEIRQRAILHHLDSSKITIKEGFGANIVKENTRKYQSETDILNNKLSALNFTLKQSENKTDSLQNIPLKGENILKEIKSLYPQIEQCAFSETYIFEVRGDSTLRSNKIPLAVIFSRRNSLGNSDKTKIQHWLQQRLNREEVKIIYEDLK